MTAESLKKEPWWRPYEVGQGTVEIKPSSSASGRVSLTKFTSPAEAPSNVGGKLTYTNAQIDDYHHLRRSDFLWRPPLRLKLRARFSHPCASISEADSAVAHLTGTAGFGFWNDPFMMTGARRPTLPRALWFFYASPPSDMQLAIDVPGYGWKAAVIDSLNPYFLGLLPTAPLGVLLMRLPFLYHALWPIAQAAMRVDERMLEASMTDWRAYEIEWLHNEVRFWINGELVFVTTRSPKGPLGMVIWLDNQSMVVTPTGRIASGLVPSTHDERLEVEELEVMEL